MRAKRMKKAGALLATGAAILLASGMAASPISSTLSYLTDMNTRIKNPYTIALDTTSKIVERFPDITSDQTKTPVITYEKSVAVINSGYVDEYVRVKIDFSESDVRGKTQFSQDGSTWYTWDQFTAACKKGLNGWYYRDDGYFYYSKILESGDWNGVSSSNLKLNTDDGHYTYIDGKDEGNLPSKMRSTKLIKMIRTDFGNYQDMKSYDVLIYNESCPYYFGNDYVSAWTEYVNSNG